MSIKDQQVNQERKGGRAYCSLDIETSGFDPLKDEILEVGFVKFQISNFKFQILEEWTQVFKPNNPVSPQIFGLTGITQEELDAAPKFAEYQQIIQEKLKDVVIVGHNVIFDIKFLEGFGIKFSGEVVDTLDLVQWILPTHHSYNLENLMHTFKISHKEAHRALADAKACLQLLEKLLQVYNGFPKMLKEQVLNLISGSNLLWQDFLTAQFEPLNFVNSASKTAAKPSSQTNKNLKIQSEKVYNFALDEDYVQTLAQARKQKILLVVPKARTALGLFRQGLAEAVFLPEWQFVQKKFTEFLDKANKTEDEIKFLLKVLVWQALNWQTKTVLDLNLSFFGGQFKNIISGGEIKENTKNKHLVCDLPTFFYLSENHIYKNHQVIICGLNEFENAITNNIGAKTSWGYVSYILKNYFDPGLDIAEDLRKLAGQALTASDLFFGLVSALYQTDPPSFLYVKITAESENDVKYLKVKSAAENYISKLRDLNINMADEKIGKFINALENFFQAEENRVKWIELSAKSCAFVSMPLDIAPIVKNILRLFAQISFVDSLDDNILPQFFLKRLGLEEFKIENVNTTSQQRDLFSGFSSPPFEKGGAKGGLISAVNYYCLDKPFNAVDIIKIIEASSALPAAVLFGSPLQVREFYEQNYQTIKKYAWLLAQNSSGGSNKIFRNFSINPNSLLLATDKFVLKSLTSQNATDPVNNLAVKTLIICRLPFDQFTHPYQEALSQNLANPFEDYSLPRALYNFHSIIKFFYTPELRDIYIIDSKLSKPYAKIFKDYWQNIPNASFN